MNVRRDHVAGGAVIAAGALVWTASGDYPFGTLASPGAGMLPTLVVGLLVAFGAVIFARAGESPPIGEIAWSDMPHAVRVAAVSVAAVALYTTLGFRTTMAALLFTLTFLIERRPFLPAVGFSIGVTALAYALFSILLKTPLPRGVMGF